MSTPRRRLRGATCATLFGVTAVASTLAGCGAPEPDSVEICGRQASPTYLVRVDDDQCDRGEPGTGRYAMQLPPTQYEYSTEVDPSDGMPYTEAYPIYAPLLVGDVGRGMPIGRGNPAAGFVPIGADSTFTTTRVPPRAAAGAALGGSTISRGGLGVTGGGKAGYGFAGSSGGS